MRLFKLMLDVEEPDARRGGDQGDRYLYHEEGANPDRPQQRDGQHRYTDVRRKRRYPRLRSGAHQSEWNAVLTDKEPGGTEAEHHCGIAVEPVADPAEPWPGAVFADSKGLNVTYPALVKVPRRRIMDRVRSAPVVVWRKGKHPD